MKKLNFTEIGQIADASPFAYLRGPVRPDLIREETLGELFSATARQYPEHVAMIEGGQQWTYSEIDAETDRLARGLFLAGIGPGDVVGLWFSRGAELLKAQIAVTKSGAAWLPFDADVPVDRISSCLADADAKAVLVGAAQADKLKQFERPVLQSAELIKKFDGVLPNARLAGLRSEHPAYLIYTSGSTGVPKGIVVSHRNICHFLRSAQETYQFRSDDIVFQGASAAFDLSMEEIWLPYLVGATLFVATPQVMADIENLPAIINDNGITVLDTVPTLLSMFPDDVPSLRIIILGGEACPPSIAARWCRSGRHVFNSYGPTEATVVATVAEVVPNEVVTIGRPIANYSAYVVSEAMELLSFGQQGELLIGGPGVATGYLNRPDLTAAKFIDNPFVEGGPDPVLYCSGDAVSIDGNGNILFHGRIDDQVKIRGFRVELGEIEARLCDVHGISQACVVLRNDDGFDQLVAFIATVPGIDIHKDFLRSALGKDLPAYMVPAHYEKLDVLPTMISGKADRKALSKMPLTKVVSLVQDEPTTPTEAALLAAAGRVFNGTAIPLDADFFMDLGGHSLLAARFVSIVREVPALGGVTLQDVYRDRTIRNLAAGLDEKRSAGADWDRRDLSFEPPPLLRRFVCGLGQAAALPFIFGIMTAQWLGVFVSYMLITDDDTPFMMEALTLFGAYAVINILTILVAIAGKWLVIGRTKPGRYPLWGVYYYRWWLAQRFLNLVHVKWFQGTPLMRYFMIAMGAKIGKDTLISDFEGGAIDLLTIGENSSIGGRCGFANAQVIGNELVIGRLDIGSDVYIGSSCVLARDVVIGDGAELLDLTAIGAGQTIGAFEKWDGSPAKKIGTVDASELPEFATATRSRRLFNNFIYAIATFALPPLGFIPMIPAFYVFDWMGNVLGDSTSLDYHWLLPIMAWPAALSLVALTVASIVVVRWAVLPRIKDGTYSIHSGLYVRKWVVSLASEVALETLSSLYATVYMRGWYRLMGAKIGKGSEISTGLAGRYDLIEIGDKCFIADEVMLGDEDVRRGWMTQKRVVTGDKVFIGNSAVVAGGMEFPDGSLIGIKSKPPIGIDMKAGDTWFGSPAIKLPVRQMFHGGAVNTFEPSIWRQIGRAVFEAMFNLSIPIIALIAFGTVAMELLSDPVQNGEVVQSALLFVGLGVGLSVSMTLLVIALKWIMIGKYKPIERPMWSWWALRTEAVAVMYSGMAARLLLDFLRGTPMMPWVLRLFGAKVGQGIYLDMTDMTEFDCIEIGNFVSINGLSALQTHLYEDRVMKVGRVSIGNGVSIESGSTVLYDTHVGDFARLGPLTVVMKGERIPDNTEWTGAPAQLKERFIAANDSQPVSVAAE